ncbi:phosphate ABC transporter substrate-binding protein [Alteromonas facilis]|uniref:phosphate ABC transporter substrate-binding protein n=1 Tax=Alteromonas facilis TaxID=2048004 RepID=UPI000C2905C5|nr:phosphate ABC transporter substrate-binding protein [Alteromonas facilis]
MLKKHMIIMGMAIALSVVSHSVLAEVVMVVHPSNAEAIDAKVVKRIFLGKDKKYPGGAEATPINQVAESDVRGQFDDSIIGRSSAQVSAYWSKLVFTGKGVPPTEVKDDAEVIATVAADPSAIGYVDSASVTGDVKAISVN